MATACTDPVLIEQCVHHVLCSDCFARSPQARRFLKYVVEQSALGHGGSLKAYTIGVSALGASSERSCPETTARMQASRVRRLLSKYYLSEGRAEQVELSLPTGVYEPRFTFRGQRPSSSDNRQLQPRVLIGRFENLSDERIDNHFCRGLTESLLGLLVSAPHLRVLRWDEANGDEGAFVLSGSVTRAGDRVRLSCHLRGPRGLETIWSDRCEQHVDDARLLRAQDAVAQRIASRIGDPAVGAVERFRREKEPRAGDPVVAAVSEFYQFLACPSADLLERARSALEAVSSQLHRTAVGAAAYSCVISLCYVSHAGARKRDLLPAEEFARIAIGIDSACGLGHFSLALLHYHYRERECALREIQRCLELDVWGATSRAGCGFLFALMGEFDKARTVLQEAEELNSAVPGYLHLARSLCHLCDEGGASRALGEVERSECSGVPADALRAACLARLGQTASARKHASQLVGRFGFTRRPGKRLKEIVLGSSVLQTLENALAEAGLSGAASSRPPRPQYKVSISRHELPSEIRLGVLQSLSGTMALSESHLVNAALLAIDEINRAGGVLNRPVRAIVEDGASDPSTFGKKARELVEDAQVSSIFGCWTSSSRKAVLPVVEEQNALLWYPLQYEGLEKSRHVIYTGSCLNQQIEPAVRWLAKQGRNSCYLLGSDYVFPRTANRLIRALVESQGGSVLGENYQPLGSAQFGQVAQEIARLQPDVIYNTVNGAENVDLFRCLVDAGVRPKTMPVMSFSLSELELTACAQYAQGQLTCWSYFQSMSTPKNQQLVEKFRRRYGPAEVLSDPAVTAYSQVHLWKQVVEKAGSLQTDELLQHLPGSHLNLGGESCEISGNKHVKRKAVIGQVEGGQFRVVWQSDKPIAPQPWLGVEETDFLSRDLVLGALQALPEMAERSSGLAHQLHAQEALVTRRNF